MSGEGGENVELRFRSWHSDLGSIGMRGGKSGTDGGGTPPVAGQVPCEGPGLPESGSYTFVSFPLNCTWDASPDDHTQQSGVAMKIIRMILLVVMVASGSLMVQGCHWWTPPAPPGLPPPPPIPVP